ncbi:transcription factor GTE8 isoform X2 [Argentina anserina]|uniref:transcription factor GTE8 isoform X2 n=1 Tax=Argentina anserina TaxID=57926 RepID=UPI0021763DC0|nr:transcription factor GTE8 isoform X2 [Potentilla anserina]
MAPTVPVDFTGQKLSMMGKSRKYSKGQLSGFVPDYRHAVETMGESEGFGSSGRVDTEMTASEDSCAPSKRKCISLNVDGHDSFGLPMQVLQLSRMSRSERKDLEVRLSFELEQVRDLQKKIATMSSTIVLSPSSDIRSCSDGKTRPPVEAYHRPSKPTGPQGKKRAPQGRNGARNKKSLSVHVESVKPVAASNAQLMKQCENLLNQLMKHHHAWVFEKPVDVVQLNIPDYFTVIKHPMDLGTVKSKLTSCAYSSPLSFAADVRLTFSNAMTYNPPSNDVHIMAQVLSKYFEQRWKAIEKKLPVDVDPLPYRPPLHTEIIETATPMPPSKKKKTTPNDSSFKPVKPEIVKLIMTDEEKHKLTMEVDSLLGELPESIIDFLKEHSGEGQTSEDEIEIDFEVLSDETLFALRKLLDEYLLEKGRRLAKAEPCEMEILNEPGFSNSSLHPCNDMVDEDVDIVGGNDAPISSFPPVEIEKDGAHKNSKCSSSSSSSSDSGSSSSDSDSASSSESESRVPKASPAFGGGKEKLGSEANLDQKGSDIGNSQIGNDPINGVVPLVGEKSLSKPISVDGGGRQEEESTPPERQVSPEKLYRAAVLRNRFADTIFKAKEKALEKGDKLDPEKLRIEREELERRRKEEKARLQAEARAAEEARKKAEAEAAAEARRQREQEREAARQALQMMEKTVEINENSRFMEDLEMFRAGDDDHLPHFIEEVSPEHSQNELGGFKLQGSCNPLEQLGLFMKADDDIEIEEEERDPSRNVEEGPSDNELGNFKLQDSSNPLEQLGLFMKADDHIDTETEEGEIDPPSRPSDNVEERPSDDVEEGPSDDVEEGPSDDVVAGPSDDVEEGPSDGVEERPSDGVEEGSSDHVEEGPSNNVEMRPSNNVEGPSNDVEMRPSDDVEERPDAVEEGPSDHVEEGTSKYVGERPTNDVGEGPSNDVEMRPSNDAEGPSEDFVDEGLSKDVEMRPSSDVDEGLSQDVGMRPSSDVEVRPSSDVEDRIISNDAEERPLNGAEGVPPNEVDIEGQPNEVDVGEGPSNGVGQVIDEVDIEGPSNEVDVGEGPLNEVEEVTPNEVDIERRSNEVDVDGGLPNHVEERPLNDVEEGPMNEVDQVTPSKVDIEGPVNEVVVEEEPGNDIAEGAVPGNDKEEEGNDMEERGQDTGEVPGNDMEEEGQDMGAVPGNDKEEEVQDMGEVIGNDMEEGPGNDLEGLANEVKEVSANGGIEEVEVGRADHVEETTTNHVEGGTASMVGDFEGEID